MCNIPVVFLRLVGPGRFPLAIGRGRVCWEENPNVQHRPQLWHFRDDIHAGFGRGARIWIELRELVNELLRLHRSDVPLELWY